MGDVGAVLPVAAHLRPQHPRRLHHARPPQTRLHRSGSIIIRHFTYIVNGYEDLIYFLVFQKSSSC